MAGGGIFSTADHLNDEIKENKDKVKVNKTLLYLVANVIELLDVDGED